MVDGKACDLFHSFLLKILSFAAYRTTFRTGMQEKGLARETGRFLILFVQIWLAFSACG
jgi:hypothetical protein